METVPTQPTVIIDCFPESVPNYAAGYAVVAVDVIRATTTAATAIAAGRRCYPVPTIEAAVPLAARLTQPLLVGELGGNMPYGFDLSNSPADVAVRNDIHRPMILLSTSGTKLICDAYRSDATYVACLRNANALSAYLAGRHAKVAVIGAGSRGEFREEDQLCCAWVAAGLLSAGYRPGDTHTAEIIDRWRGAPLESILDGHSADYLRRTGQHRDLDFILRHINDLEQVLVYRHDEIIEARTSVCPDGRTYPPGNSLRKDMTL